jgi:glycosyltransferase involved in cell wall biosynthesis
LNWDLVVTLEKQDVLVIIPTLNEEGAIGPTIADINQSLNSHQCLVVDGKSVDKTVDIAKSSGAQVIFQKGLGKGDAIASAIEHSKSMDIKYIAFIDADYTYPAKYFSIMTKILDENPEIGMVTGNRFNPNMETKSMSTLNYIGNKLLAFAQNLMVGIKLYDPLTGFRLIKREILNGWIPKSKGFDIEIELNCLVKNKGYEIEEIPINYRCRIGSKKLRPIHGLLILKRIIHESMLNE